MWWLVGLALAHPYGHRPGDPAGSPSVFGLRLTVDVADDALRVTFVAEIPRRVFPPAPLETLGPELQGALALRWDDQPLALTWTAPRAEPGDSGFVDLRLEGVGPLPAPAGTLRLRNGAFPDQDCFYSTTVNVPGDRVVTRSSLVRVKDGRLRDNRHGAWTREEAARELEVELRRARPWERVDGPRTLPERMAGLDSLAPGAGTVAGAVVALLLVLVGATRIARRRRRSRMGAQERRPASC